MSISLYWYTLELSLILMDFHGAGHKQSSEIHHFMILSFEQEVSIILRVTRGSS